MADQPTATKPGVQTSEFWLSLIAMAATAFSTISGHLNPQIAAIVGAVITAVYTIARALTKSNAPDLPKV